jgi:hypothetical protein
MYYQSGGAQRTFNVAADLTAGHSYGCHVVHMLQLRLTSLRDFYLIMELQPGFHDNCK